jgi:hypothetical protein
MKVALIGAALLVLGVGESASACRTTPQYPWRIRCRARDSWRRKPNYSSRRRTLSFRAQRPNPDLGSHMERVFPHDC